MASTPESTDARIDLLLAAQESFLQEIRGSITDVNKRVAVVKEKIDSQISSIAKSVAVCKDDFACLASDIGNNVAAQIAEYDVASLEYISRIDAAATTRIAVLESAAAAFESWQPTVNSSIGNVKLSVDRVRDDISELDSYSERAETDEIPSGTFATRSASGNNHGGRKADGSRFGHHSATHHRDGRFGSVFT